MELSWWGKEKYQIVLEKASIWSKELCNEHSALEFFA